MRTLSPPALRLSIGAAAALLGACAVLPLEPDRNARAPQLDGFGVVNMPMTSASPAARQWFEQGMAQVYAFNEVEAVRAFKAGLAQDPDCAMCAWGVAYQLGPTINSPGRDANDVKEARRYIDYALRHADKVSPREKALIEAMALRYGHASEARNTAPLMAAVCGSGDDQRPRDPLDIAYAERMRSLADRYPDDPDILSIYAEAELVATIGEWWDPVTGKPGGRVGEVATRLETALPRHLEHTGLNHYLIHATDALPVASRALPAADRLGALAPKSPHLVHMPSHTYALVGRYADATAVNQLGMAADAALTEKLKSQGFDVSKDWRGHNSRFQWYGAVMEGRGELALETVRASAERAAKADHAFGEYVRSLPILTLMRLERWDAVLAEPLPSGGKGLATVLGEQARGTALARRGQHAEAAAALARLEPAAEVIMKAHPSKDFMDRMLRGMADSARLRLRAEVALGERRYDEALALQTQAVTAAKDLDSTEPPMFAAGTRLALGDMQLQAQRWAEAEQSFRRDLVDHPHSGWALRGLTLALQGQGRSADAEAQRNEMAHRWNVADATLRRSVDLR